MRTFAGLPPAEQTAACRAWLDAALRSAPRRPRCGSIASTGTCRTERRARGRPHLDAPTGPRPGEATPMRRLERFLPAASAERLAAARIGLCAVLAGRLATGPYAELADQPRELYRPISFMELLAVDATETRGGRATDGRGPGGRPGCGRPAHAADPPAAWACAIVLNGMVTSTGKVVHNDLVLLLCLVPLLVAPAADAWSLDAIASSEGTRRALAPLRLASANGGHRRRRGVLLRGPRQARPFRAGLGDERQPALGSLRLRGLRTRHLHRRSALARPRAQPARSSSSSAFRWCSSSPVPRGSSSRARCSSTQASGSPWASTTSAQAATAVVVFANWPVVVGASAWRSAPACGRTGLTSTLSSWAKPSSSSTLAAVSVAARSRDSWLGPARPAASRRPAGSRGRRAPRRHGQGAKDVLLAPRHGRRARLLGRGRLPSAPAPAPGRPAARRDRGRFPRVTNAPTNAWRTSAVRSATARPKSGSRAAALDEVLLVVVLGAPEVRRRLDLVTTGTV